MKDKSLAKKIRNSVATFLMFFVSTILFIFKKINTFGAFFNKKTLKTSKKFHAFLREYKSSIKEGFVALLICATGDLIAGIFLGNMTYFLETFPGLLVLIPGAIGMRGNIFGSFGSRLSTNLHIGILTPEFKKSETLSQNILSSLILTLVLSLFLGVLAKLICILFNFESMPLVDFVLISVIAGLISSVIMLPITMFVSLKSFENGWDPDNVTTPVIAAIGDLFTLPAIILSIFILTLFSFSDIVKYAIFVLLIILIVVSFIYGIKSACEETKEIIRQSTPVLFLCSFLGILAGGVFNNSLTTLLTNPSLLTLVPLFSGESGSLISILGARLSSALHSGLIEPILRPKRTTFYNFLICLILAIIFYPFIGFLADASSLLLGVESLGFGKIIPISTIAGLILVPIMMVIVFYISTISYRKGLDPDNIVIPISTSLTDSVSSLILVIVALAFTGGILI